MMTPLESLGFYDITQEPADPEISALRQSVNSILWWRQKYEDGEVSAHVAMAGIRASAESILGI